MIANPQMFPAQIAQIDAEKTRNSLCSASANELVSEVKEVKSYGRGRDYRFWRRFSQVERLSRSQRKQIVEILDAFLEREKLKKASRRHPLTFWPVRFCQFRSELDSVCS
jgi:hypothetical protein